MSENSDKTFTKADVDSAIATAVAEAVAPLQAKLAEFDQAASAADIDKKIADAVSAATEPLTKQIEETQAKLDQAALDLNAEKARADQLELEKTEAADAAAAESRKAERTTKAKELAGFTDAQLSEKASEDGPTRIERFAAMSDDAWAATIDAWAATAATRKTGDDTVPRKTALVASADDGADVTKGSSAMRKVAAGRTAGDVTSLIKR